MKNRLLYNWTLKRKIYVILGIFLSVEAIIDRQWLALLFGLYFTLMGMFAFGCAGNSCFQESRTEKQGTKENENQL
ncbi:MAG TPA: hypothetical protein VLB84_04380 [Bacteroidia bacterium]|jgi:hypothetical protein|nr:hypothetical protein [Bacteroidia bacterium]